MTRRDRIREIVAAKLRPFTEALGGHSLYESEVEKTVNAIMDLSAPAEEIIHVIGPNGNHRLIVDGESTEWKAQTELAAIGRYVAATDFYMGQLPQVSRITPIDAKQFMTTSQQDLRKSKIEFVRP